MSAVSAKPRVTTLLLATTCVAIAWGGCRKNRHLEAEAKYGSPLEKLRKARMEIRAYEGAPPLVPHGLGRLGRKACLACHREGSALMVGASRPAPITPHPDQVDCRQCHVERLLPADSLFVESTFVGAEITASSYPDRAHPAGPPYVPHRLQDRENCRVCHLSATAPPELVPSHGDRVNCGQCHLRLDEEIGSFVAAGPSPSQVIE